MKNTEAFDIGKFSVNCIIASFMGVAAAFILTAVCALLLNFVQIPESFYGICSVAIYIAVSAFSGIVAKRKSGASALLCGIVCAVLLCAMLFALSLVIHTPQKASLWQLVILPSGAILGAMLIK